MVKILWLLRRGKLEGGGLLNASFFLHSLLQDKSRCTVSANATLFWDRKPTVGLDHFLWGFVLALHSVLIFISVVTLVV